MFDKAMRDSLSSLMVSEGEVMFSPFIFKREDLGGELSESEFTQQ